MLTLEQRGLHVFLFHMAIAANLLRQSRPFQSQRQVSMGQSRADFLHVGNIIFYPTALGFALLGLTKRVKRRAAQWFQHRQNLEQGRYPFVLKVLLE